MCSSQLSVGSGSLCRGICCAETLALKFKHGLFGKLAVSIVVAPLGSVTTWSANFPTGDNVEHFSDGVLSGLDEQTGIVGSTLAFCCSAQSGWLLTDLSDPDMPLVGSSDSLNGGELSASRVVDAMIFFLLEAFRVNCSTRTLPNS